MENALVTPEGSSRELTDEEKKRLDEIIGTLALDDPNAVIRYGMAVQSRSMEFADSVLSAVREKDSGEAGRLLADLMRKLKELDVDSLSGGKGGLLSRLPFLGSLVDNVRKFMDRYQDLSTQVMRIVDELEKSRIRLLDDVEMLDGLYENNLQYYYDLGLHIMAGEMKLRELRDVVIPPLKAGADASSDPVDTHKYRDMVALAERLDRKLHDLRLSRSVALQSGPQIRLVQGNNQVLAEKIQSSVINAVPLWKNQMVLAISLLRQRQAVAMQREVSATTNELLERNAEMLSESSKGVAEEASKGIIDIETLKKVNAELISTIDETLRIQAEGSLRRKEAEQEIIRMERELKDKLLELKDRK